MDELMADGEGILRAMQRAVQQALLAHKKLGHSIVVEENGEVVEIPPEEIRVVEGRP